MIERLQPAPISGQEGESDNGSHGHREITQPGG